MLESPKPLCALTVQEFTELIEGIIRKALELEKNGIVTNSSAQADETMTIRQCASFLNCSLVSLHNYKKQGLPYYKVGRKVLFRKKEVLDFMKSTRKGRFISI